jgi:hypothetical protein
MARAGHPNQDVTVYFLRGEKFQKIDIPELIVDIPKRCWQANNSHWHASTGKTGNAKWPMSDVKL